MMTAFLRNWFAKPIRPRVITFGNQKGGSGKTTSVMNVMIGLMSSGYSVGSIDLDGDQATFTHFTENRRRQRANFPFPLDMPEHRLIENSLEPTVADAEEDEAQQLALALEDLKDRDYIVIDTPGNDTYLSRLGHVLADTLITPMNDSFLDLDVLVRLDVDGRRIIGPSSYAVQVLDRWGLRVLITGKAFDWIVIRNRLAHLGTKNSDLMHNLLNQLAPRLGFRTAQGFSERVIFRELFPKGLTLLDPQPVDLRGGQAKSRAAARDEVWDLLSEIGMNEIPQARANWDEKLALQLSSSRFAQENQLRPGAFENRPGDHNEK